MKTIGWMAVVAGIISWAGTTAVVTADDTVLGLKGERVVVLPVVLDEGAGPQELGVRLGEVLATFLERGGALAEMAEGEVSLAPSDTSEMVERRLADWIAEPDDRPTFVLLAALEGLGELKRARIWLTNDEGIMLLVRDEVEFPSGRPEDSMGALVFVVQTLRERSDLGDPMRPDAPEGAMAERLRQRGGEPSRVEIEAMEKRWTQARGKFSEASLTVFPPHVWGAGEGMVEGAGTLAEKIRQAGLAKAVAVRGDPRLELRGDPNQLKVLWDTARAFRAWLRQHPPETDYALFVDAGPLPQVHHLHLILCDRSGEWVMVDLLNSHREDFQEVSPDSLEDCVELAQRRLQTRLEESG